MFQVVGDGQGTSLSTSTPLIFIDTVQTGLTLTTTSVSLLTSGGLCPLLFSGPLTIGVGPVILFLWSGHPININEKTNKMKILRI